MVSEHVETHSPDHESGLVVLELAFSAAFRPIEIANLLTRNVRTGSGELSPYLEVMPGTSKWGKGRKWPWSPRLKLRMERLIALHPAAERVAFSRRADGTYDYWNAQKVGKWIRDMCRAVGLDGCSGMSGRRTVGTRLGAEVLRAGRPVEDVQAALGHSRLSTTQFYLEPTNDLAVLEAAVRMLGRTNHREWKAHQGIEERQREIRHAR
jgi:integrase